jgi:hypothetical protein
MLELRGFIALALVPLAAGAFVGLLLLPRRPLPTDVPIPIPDRAALARTAAADDALAARARATPLPGAVRALGSALRDFHSLEAKGAEARELAPARRAIDTTLIDALGAGDDALLELRAVQLGAFLAEVRGFESTGLESPELQALAGGFVRSMRSEGWCQGHKLALSETERRVLFKQMWSTLLGRDGRGPLALMVDEHRVLSALALAQPRLPPAQRAALAVDRASAKSDRECESVAISERKATEKLLLDRIARLSFVDPDYPAAYARGVARFQGGSFSAAVDDFREWLQDHPDGPLALRARGYLRAATSASAIE